MQKLISFFVFFLFFDVLRFHVALHDFIKILFTDGTHQIKNAIHCVRVFGLNSVKCNSLNISYFLIIGCVVLSTLKCVTTCVIGVCASWSTCGRIGRVKLTVARLSPEILFVSLRQSLPSLLQVPVAGAMS